MTHANLLTNLIVSDLNARGHLAWRNSTMGTYDRATGRYRTAHRSAIGTADVICCLKGGRYLELEVKVGKDTQSTGQELHERAVKQAGGMYFVVKDRDAYMQLRQSEGW